MIYFFQHQRLKANHLTDFKDVELEKQQAKKAKESEGPCSSEQLTMQE